MMETSEKVRERRRLHHLAMNRLYYQAHREEILTKMREHHQRKNLGVNPNIRLNKLNITERIGHIPANILVRFAVSCVEEKDTF